jgi:hypothetical protein
VYPQHQGSDCISRTQSDRRERRNKEIGSSQALGSSAGLTRRLVIGSVRPEIAATQGCVGFRRNNQSADTARHRPKGSLSGMHVCTLRRVHCASETQKAAVSAVSRGTRRSRIALYAAGPRKQRMASLRIDGRLRCPMGVAARRLSFTDRCDDRHQQQRQVVFIRCPRQEPPNQASVCPNAKGSNSDPSARVKPTRFYSGVGYAADAACLVLIIWPPQRTTNCTHLLGLH